MRGSAIRWLVMLLGVMCFAAVLPAASAHAYTAVEEPWLTCLVASHADLAALETSLSPANAATATVGTPVSFSGASGAPLSFAVGSRTPLLQPDIDTGAGIASGEPPTAGGEVNYAFGSANASALARTIFWTASFSDASLHGCERQPPTVYTTPVRSLTVLPLPTEATSLPAAAPPPASLKVSIGALGKFRMTHPRISFSIDCTASCAGETRSLAYLVRGSAKPLSVPALDFGPSPMSITAAAGGTQKFTHHYTGRSLRVLRHLLHTGRSLELKIDAKLIGTSGAVVHAQRTAQLG